ncbi:hypothetical protein G6F37_012866 [Rhizopus arrhizus]|nr:hypothetical protein G6F38_010282 [Rhizopus arrhizus]KAG1141116.1 hypothetical protein G6F37_012866 [Rhizopus arrhizus]
MNLQAPTTPVGHPGTSVPPVLATTGKPASQSLSPSMTGTLVSTPSKDKLDSSAPVSATTSTADIQDHWIIGPVTAKFRQYQCMADSIPKPCPLEPNVQEILALANVLFLAPEQHSDAKMAVFGQELLDEAMSHQTKMLLDKVPTPCSGFTPTDFMTIVDVVSAIDAKTMSPKQARLQLLTLASSMNDLRANVIEGIADMLINMPQNPIADQGKFGKIDLQTRFYNPLLASILADVTKKVLLRWPNKMEETVPQIRPDAIVSTVVQLKLGPSLGYGEVKLGDDSTTNQSLCIDTMKLAVLSRNAAQKNGHPIISFQVNVQELGRHLHTMLEIGRLTVPNSLASLHSFITPKNLSMLLRVTSIFWNCCVHDTPSFTSVPPSKLQEIATLFSMTDESSSKARECTIRYD